MFKYLLLFSGAFLLVLNLYGLTQPLRPQGLSEDVMRFGERDVSISPEELAQRIQRKEGESPKDYAARLTKVLAAGIAHLEWEYYEPTLFHQTVPVWENYILFLMGKFSGISEYERYHFTDPYRSMERGIGICGDASMTLSGLLDKQNIANKIVTLPGHVMVEAHIDGEKFVLDADYGVVMQKGMDFYQSNPKQLIENFQTQHGAVNDGELMIASQLKAAGFQYWNGTSHFVTKKYYFEKIAYVFKWVIPVLLVCISLLLFYRQHKNNPV